MINDKITAKGVVEFILQDEHGNVKETRTCNLVVRAGVNYIARRMIGTADSVMSHIGVGSSAVATATEQTALSTQVGSRRPLDDTPLNTNSTITYTAVFVPGTGTGTLREAGLFNAETGGIMLARTTFPALVKNAPDTLTINWSITINAS